MARRKDLDTKKNADFNMENCEGFTAVNSRLQFDYIALTFDIQWEPSFLFMNRSVYFTDAT